MNEDTVQDYLARFDEYLGLIPKDDRSSVWFFELSEDALAERQQSLADLIHVYDGDDTDEFHMGCLIFYGYRLGTMRLDGKSICFTRQGGYKDKAIIKYDTDDILEYEIEETNNESNVSRLIQWIINPESNLEISDNIIKRMIVPMINNLSKVTPPGKKAYCKVILPPVSKDIEDQNWESLFSNITADNIQISISNYGQLLNIDDGDRSYFFIHQSDGTSEYVIISAYEIIRGHNTCIGSIAFDVNDDDNMFELHDFNEASIEINNRSRRYEKRRSEEEIVNHWHYVKGYFPASEGLLSYLGSHTVTFYREMYKISDFGSPNISPTVKAIKAVFKANEALQADEICARLFAESNTYNISLGDLAYVSNLLHKDSSFVPVLISTKKHYKLGTLSISGFSIDWSKFNNLPSNFSTITWKIRNINVKIKPYFYLDQKKHSLDEIILSIIDHFEHCTTATVAEELLYVYKNGEDPSALFAAKIFMYLSQMKAIEIESRNEVITNFQNVDDIVYEEIDKSKILLSSNSIKKRTIFSSKSQGKGVVNKSTQKRKTTEITIDEMKFSVRTHNCLKRAGVRTLADLTKKTPRDLTKIRNLGRKGAEEVIDKVYKWGCTFS